MDDRSAEATRFTVDGNVATLVLNQPESRNALNQPMREGIAAAVASVRGDRSIAALVITGAGWAFCAGGDLKFIAGSGLDGEGWRHRMMDAHEWLQGLITLDRPVIAAVDGAAYGAGFSLALTADFILASQRARFCMSFLRVGGIPDMGAFHTLPRVVGPQRAKEIFLSARDIDAEEAARLGIVMEIHPAEHLAQRARALAESFVHASPTAVSLIKRAVALSPGAGLAAMLEIEAAGQALAFGTEAHRQAVARFLDKQPAPFQWPAR